MKTAAFRCFCCMITLMLLGCAPRGQFVSLAPEAVAVGTVLRVFVASERTAFSAEGATFGDVRPDQLRFGTTDVSVPPNHTVGQIEWPRGQVDPAKHFALVGNAEVTELSQFVRRVQNAQTTSHETFVFVHGFNVNNAEAVYRVAQIAHDFEIPVPAMVYSWPSAGHPAANVYDRDSIVFARDGLEQVLTALLQRPEQRVVLVGHSMGSQLVMEVLRQLTISGRQDIVRKIAAVSLISPDIDPDVFRRQMDRIDPIPKDFTIFASEEDRALNVSSLLVGRKSRLGAIRTAEELQGLPVTLVDLSQFASDFSDNHLTVASSAAAVSFVRGLVASGRLATGSSPRVIRAPVQ